MDSKEGESESNGVEPKEAEEETSVTMVDVLEQEKELEAEYAAVLGASDEKCCTYTNGPMPRQALYSCLTCCPEARNDLAKCAGICLACSYRCHENHELVELYTKRNFRCDCPTERFGEQHICALNASLTGRQPQNANNQYNQNFQGIYCNCQRPYPDPERTAEEVMLQCAICEDWFHLQHLDVNIQSATKLVDTCAEIVCNGCMKKHDFLRDYTGLALKALEDADDSLANITVGCEQAAPAQSDDNDDNKLRSDLDKSISDIMGAAEVNNEINEEPPTNKRAKLEATETNTEANTDNTPSISNATVETKCKRPAANSSDYDKGATFWGNDWRTALCRCATCSGMYKMQKLEFLLDPDDSAKSYEERGMRRAATAESTYEQGIRALASIGRVQQINAITEYNHMKDKLKEYLQTFAVSKKVVTEEDINRFFEQMRNEKNTQLGQPYFCR